MKTLKLFNAVLSKKTNNQIFISTNGFVIDSRAVWVKDQIQSYYSKELLNGNDLNKTFHKSWSAIKESSDFELYREQITHYLSTYGTDFNEEIYIPNEVLNIPDLKLTYKVVKGLSKEVLIGKCLSLLKSGIALKEETIDDVISILTDELDYKFHGNEGVKNKEAIVKIAERFNVFPSNPVEFFRYIIYRTTDTTLLIKNKELVSKIKESSFNPSYLFKDFGLDKLAEIFNRFKPLFLAYKNRSSKTINKISKLSKKDHIPLIGNPLNNVTNKLLSTNDNHWLDNATSFTLFKALSACYNRMNGQDIFTYRIRNGKSYTKEGKTNSVNKENYKFILNYLKDKYNFKGKTFYIPNGVKYALPTSEKMFVGNIPTGTTFTERKMAVGVYWKNSWGASDLDLSGLNIGGKVGWNSKYKQDGGRLMYSGDITSAPDGAVEYLYANNGLKEPTLVLNNVYSGDSNCEYKIIIGSGDNVNRNYMMNPNNLLLDEKCESVQKQTVLGMYIPKKKKQQFVLLNFGAGNIRVSGNSELSTMTTKALYQQWKNPLTLKKVLKDLGAEFKKSNDNVDFDLSLNSLNKSAIIDIFKES